MFLIYHNQFFYFCLLWVFVLFVCFSCEELYPYVKNSTPITLNMNSIRTKRLLNLRNIVFHLKYLSIIFYLINHQFFCHVTNTLRPFRF